MLTKIGKYLFATNNGATVIPSLDEQNTGVFPWRTINSSDTAYFGSYIRYHSQNTLLTSIPNTNTSGIAVGSGRTPATDSDYNMETIISSGLSASFSSATKAYDSATGKTYTYINVTLTNTGSSDISVGEIGLFVTARAASTRGNTTPATEYVVMADHTVLDSPVTIAPASAAVIQYRFEVDDAILPPIS